MSTDYKKEFIKCLKSVDYSRSDWDIFNDFLEMASISIANVFLKSPDYEKEYMQIADRHKKNIDKFPELLAILANALEKNPWQDFLGTVYQDINANNKHLGQFFTPFHVSDMMAQCTLDADTLKKQIEEQSYFTLSEPCSGAGGMIIACAKAVQELGFNPQEAMYFEAIDLDKKCFAMTYLQTSLLGLAGEVYWGNTISYQMFRKYPTPRLLSDIWQCRFMARKLAGKVERLITTAQGVVENRKEEATEKLFKPKQLALSF